MSLAFFLMSFVKSTASTAGCCSRKRVDAVLLTKDIRKNARDINTLSEDDITAAESVLKVIEPMKTVTTIMCSEKIHLVHVHLFFVICCFLCTPHFCRFRVCYLDFALS
jgi:hypothetical protein